MGATDRNTKEKHWLFQVLNQFTWYSDEINAVLAVAGEWEPERFLDTRAMTTLIIEKSESMKPRAEHAAITVRLAAIAQMQGIAAARAIDSKRSAVLRAKHLLIGAFSGAACSAAIFYAFIWAR